MNPKIMNFLIISLLIVVIGFLPEILAPIAADTLVKTFISSSIVKFISRAIAVLLEIIVIIAFIAQWISDTSNRYFK